MSSIAGSMTQPITRAPATIVEPGRNCWRVEHADRFAAIQDAADYFRLVRRAMLGARRTIFTLGWDTSADTDLLPGEHPGDGPTRFAELVADIARRRPDLRCYVLTWDFGLLHTLERDPFTRWRLGWRMPTNVRFAFDGHHAVGGCHHQKVVVIDDQLAFAGGIDLTGHRWDTAAHRVDEPRRVSLDGDVYGPYHEVQAMVSGPAAAALGVLARDRWRAIGVDDLPPVAPSGEDLWPGDTPPDLTSVRVAISRTVPVLDDQAAIRECEALYADSIAAARSAIYIESQYFTDERLGRTLAARLREPNGPEVIVVTPRDCHGWLEQKTMCAFRNAVVRELVAADVHRRLRVVYPAASRLRDVATFVHSKVMFVDDRLARIGSANFSQRSMGVDTECDLTVDAGEDRDACAGIVRMRNRLIGEHLGLPPDAVAREIEARGSIRALVDAHQGEDHTLVRVIVPAEVEPVSDVLRAAADPAEPIAVVPTVNSLMDTSLLAAADPGRRVGIPALALAGLAVMAGAAALRYGVRHPARARRLVAGGAVLLLVAGAGLRFWMGGQQVGAVVSGQRRRAEFG